MLDSALETNQDIPDLKVIPRDEHCISRKNISDSALKVMSRLRNKGYQAYLVGGAVRDLLLGGHPKDFDVATDATPEDVHALFRNSRIIGRRFRIVHVRFGREIIEVTTFRGHHTQGGETQAKQSSSGLLLRDNVYGTLEEDAVRRDLTVNALYYDAGSFEVFDHVHGLEDLEAQRIAIIGDPEVRFTEDPVRMLRVLRFAAKLDFTIEDETRKAIPRCAHLLAEIPAARLFDEFLKLFLAGYAAATLEQLLTHDLLQYLFPETSACLMEDDQALALRELYLSNNSLAGLPSSLMDRLGHLTDLNLSHNAVSNAWLKPGFAAFASLSRLVAIDLSHNELTRLFASTLRGLTSLQVFTASGNAVERVDDGVFDGVGSLQALVLSHNKIGALGAGTFRGLDRLTSLALDHNRIKGLHR